MGRGRALGCDTTERARLHCARRYEVRRTTSGCRHHRNGVGVADRHGMQIIDYGVPILIASSLQSSGEEDSQLIRGVRRPCVQ
jgi:hypothetical protein